LTKKCLNEQNNKKEKKKKEDISFSPLLIPSN